MQGNDKVIDHLNQILYNELRAINQYFLHSRMLADWGLNKFAEYEYGESMDEMKHADQLIQRILFLEGLPNLQNLGHLYIAENPIEILDNDLKLEHEAIPDLKKAIFEMLRVTKKGGYVIFDIQNIQNHEINEIYKKHIYENSNFFGKFYKTCKNFIKLILRKGITEWDFAIYEVPSDPLSIINELRLKKIDDFQTLVPVTKDNITTLIEIQSDFDMYPRIIFLVKI